MSRYSEVVAKAMGLTNAESESILFTSPMHDIGKIGIHDAILLKKGKLTDEEREEMKKHTIYGAEILTGSKHKLIKQAETIALTHHERWDGKGYPQGLKGEAIPLEGRIVALADVFDALSSTRCYKAAFDINEVIDLIIKESGAHFDPEVVKAFLSAQEKIMEIFNNYKEQ
jgi:putative two-component system response regulator